jgi:deazaflavin-dependent oxidoreductase (nitroreductase family)
MSAHAPDFREPSGVERIFNKAFGLLVGLGLAPRYNYLVEVRGRKTGRVYAAPVNVLEMAGRSFLVAPRGRTQWVRNAEAAGEVVLKRGASRRRFRIRAVTNDDKPEILKTYLDRFKLAVQRYFPVPAGSDARAFRDIAHRYPVFELLVPSEAPSAR